MYEYFKWKNKEIEESLKKYCSGYSLVAQYMSNHYIASSKSRLYKPWFTTCINILLSRQKQKERVALNSLCHPLRNGSKSNGDTYE